MTTLPPPEPNPKPKKSEKPASRWRHDWPWLLAAGLLILLTGAVLFAPELREQATSLEALSTVGAAGAAVLVGLFATSRLSATSKSTYTELTRLLSARSIRALEDTPPSKITLTINEALGLSDSYVGLEFKAPSPEPTDPTEDSPSVDPLVEHLVATERTLAEQEVLLREIVDIGLRQTKTSFFLAQLFGVAGGAIIIGGAVFSFFRASTGDVDASILVSTGLGAVVSATSALFVRQANKTRESLVGQAAEMRRASQYEKRVNEVRRFASLISNEARRDDLYIAAALSSFGSNAPSVTQEPERGSDDD